MHTPTLEDSLLGVELGEMSTFGWGLAPVPINNRRKSRKWGILRLLSGSYLFNSSVPHSVMGQGPGKDI